MEWMGMHSPHFTSLLPDVRWEHCHHLTNMFHQCTKNLDLAPKFPKSPHRRRRYPIPHPTPWCPIHFLTTLKGKFSSGIEGALALTLNHDFNWKQLSEKICLFRFSFGVFKVYLSNIDPENSRHINKNRLWILGLGVAFYYDLKYNR